MKLSPSSVARPARKHAMRAGFSMIEVMISSVILAGALLVMGGNIASLNLEHQAEREEAKVQNIANQLVERIMGATFTTLGKVIGSTTDHQAWAWERRATLLPAAMMSFYGESGTQPINPPMKEGIPTTDPNYAYNDLVGLGLETQRSGLNNVRVYVEYYNMNILGDILAKTQANADPHKAWVAEVGDPTLTNPVTIPPTIPVSASPTTTTNIFLPESTSTIDLSTVATIAASQNDAVLVRVLVFWVSAQGGQRWHEVVILRRQ